jgi:hypothetical protein
MCGVDSSLKDSGVTAPVPSPCSTLTLTAKTAGLTFSTTSANPAGRGVVSLTSAATAGVTCTTREPE